MISTRMQRRFLAAAMAAAALSLAGAAHAGAVLDQSSPKGYTLFNDLIEWQQEVTPGLTGRLDGITLYGDNFVYNGQLVFGDGSSDLVRIALGYPRVAPTFLFSAKVELMYGGTYIDTSAANIQLTAGQSFIIDVSGGDLNGFYGSDSAYGGGQLYSVQSYGGGKHLIFQPGNAIAFKSYVEQAPVAAPAPEPGTWALMLTGFGGLGTMLRWRRSLKAA